MVDSWCKVIPCSLLKKPIQESARSRQVIATSQSLADEQRNGRVCGCFGKIKDKGLLLADLCQWVTNSSRPEKVTRKGSSQQFNNPLRLSGKLLHLLLGHRLPRLSEVGQGLLLQT